MNLIVKFRGFPMQFSERAGIPFGAAVPLEQATRFTSSAAAHARASRQWGAEGMIHTLVEAESDSSVEKGNLETIEEPRSSPTPEENPAAGTGGILTSKRARACRPSARISRQPTAQEVVPGLARARVEKIVCEEFAVNRAWLLHHHRRNPAIGQARFAALVLLQRHCGLSNAEAAQRFRLAACATVHARDRVRELLDDPFFAEKFARIEQKLKPKPEI